jgi:hypothetical protein
VGQVYRSGIPPSRLRGSTVRWVRCVAVLVVSIAVLCPAASAGVRSRLDLMPLPRTALGPGAGALALARNSGVLSNADAAKTAGNGFTAATLAKLGRISGYTLDYRLPNATVPQTRHELLGVQTIAELYSSRTTATRGLAFWRRLTRKRTVFPNGITVAASPFQARVGNASFAFELTYRESGLPLYFVGDVVFRSGSLLGAVFVSATDERGLRMRTLQLADALESRMKGVLAGQIHAAPVKLPTRH